MSIESTMLRAASRRAILMGAAAGATVAGASLLNARTTSAGHQEDEEAIIGSWFALVNPPAGPVGALITFNADGTLTQTSTVATSGPGHGAWERVSDREYLFIIRWFVFSAEGSAIGSGKSRARILVSADLRGYTGQAHIDRFDLAGNVVDERDAPAQAARIVVEPLI